MADNITPATEKVIEQDWDNAPEYVEGWLFEDDEPVKKDCSICKNDGINPAGEGSRVVGSRWNEARQRNVVFNGYACEMHLDSFTKKRFL